MKQPGKRLLIVFYRNVDNLWTNCNINVTESRWKINFLAMYFGLKTIALTASGTPINVHSAKRDDKNYTSFFFQSRAMRVSGLKKKRLTPKEPSSRWGNTLVRIGCIL
jgi:hypothetical protein